MSDWYKSTIEQVLEHQKVDKRIGLPDVEAQLRLRQYGPNEFSRSSLRSPWKLFLAQFSSTVVLVLLVSTVISAALGDLKNALAIGAILILNAVLGFTQEHRAERALAALRRLGVPKVKVRRDGRLHEIGAGALVPGDVVVLEAGSLVPADGRIIESVNLRTQESALTGESQTIDKNVRSLGEQDLPLAERVNMVYAGTVVTYGRGLMVVTESGMTTELGRIAAMIQSIDREQTPLEKRLDQLGTRLALIALAIVGVIFVLGLVRGEDLKLMFMTAVSIAVAAVPEGLPAIVTLNLAFGAQRLLKKQALIRHLPAVETLGSVTVICTDKTGTLTENKMVVAFVDVADQQIDLRTREMVADSQHPSVPLLLIASALCNDTVLEGNPSNVAAFRAVGEPTESALAVAAAQHGFHKAELEHLYPRVAEWPFDSERKRMSTLHNVSDFPFGEGRHASRAVFVKGAVDSVLDVSTGVFSDGTRKTLDAEWRHRIQSAQNNLAQSGMRVMGVAYRFLNDDFDTLVSSQSAIESDLVFVGLVGLRDPIRAEVKEAVEMCLSAGIKPVMITGDHPLTAKAIARELGFGESRVVTGPELDRFSPEELEALVDKTFVYARVAPEHKLNIVRALQRRGHVVAMTGDGVNDAPALKQSDIGVAMGVVGTDVAKESSDLVLLDDNFATIVSAVKEGRVIYENIRKFLLYLLTGNVGEIWLMFLAPLLGMPLPLLPVQILWMNLVTDGIPALALGLEPAGRHVMRRPPVPPNEHIFGGGMGGKIARFGLLVGLLPLGIGAWYWHQGSPLWQTMVFTTLIMLHVEMAFSFKSQHDSFFAAAFSNKPLLVAVLLSIGLQLAVVYTPWLQSFFGTVSLPPMELAICVVSGTAVFWLAEAEKLVQRRFARKRSTPGFT